ncbi:hypothetical protein D9C73_013963 [Collichthys lucidus]|uniref:Kinocilin n=1 Tax=Collichthys lucidus TaxID=240159 RepID=A0A4U5UWW0_COLLU|nr:hypothetical protein D9C73_013963 [Collichthys lucidus]
MNTVSIGEYHGLRVGASLLSIVAGCILIGVSRECDADAIGGIFLGAGGLATQVSQVNLERTKSRMGTFVEGGPVGETNPDEGHTGRLNSTETYGNLSSHLRIRTCHDNMT